MSTQGILSVVRQGKTLMKVVAGCNGYNIPNLEKEFQAHPTTDPKTLHGMALACEVGCDRCLVLQVSPIEFIMPEDDELGDALPRWRDKFSDPRFNPRWDNGTAAYTSVVDIDLCQEKSPAKNKSKSSRSGRKRTSKP